MKAGDWIFLGNEYTAINYCKRDIGSINDIFNVTQSYKVTFITKLFKCSSSYLVNDLPFYDVLVYKEVLSDEELLLDEEVLSGEEALLDGEVLLLDKTFKNDSKKINIHVTRSYSGGGRITFKSDFVLAVCLIV